MSIDRYFERKYDKAAYNCGHFVRDVWFDLTGDDISGPLGGFLTGPGNRRAILTDLRAFKRLKTPQSPCIVLFQGFRVAPHVGVYLRDKVLHISKEYGVRFDRIEFAGAGAKKTSFYTC